jgi:hypothetical protein
VILRRAFVMALLVVAWLASGVTVAAADPPGPTDYLSDVTKIEPDVPGIHVEIVGGDSFVLINVDPGITVVVVGYSGEPYLRILPDGTVEENRRSPSEYLNQDRYAAVAVPAYADADAAPEWVVVATNGSYAWHDHRTHWMSSVKPPGKVPGDQVAEGVIPLFVDGVAVDVTVASYWQQPPSAVPVVLGATVGVIMAFAAVRRRGGIAAAIVMAGAAVTTAVGAVAYCSMPRETGPPWSLWALPAAALVVAVAAWMRRSTFAPSSYRILMLLAALELVAWGWLHWTWLWAALLPTRLPFWMDRFISVATLVGAIGAMGGILLEALMPKREISFRP